MRYSSHAARSKWLHGARTRRWRYRVVAPRLCKSVIQQYIHAGIPAARHNDTTAAPMKIRSLRMHVYYHAHPITHPHRPTTTHNARCTTEHDMQHQLLPNWRTVLIIANFSLVYCCASAWIGSYLPFEYVPTNGNQQVSAEGLCTGAVPTLCMLPYRNCTDAASIHTHHQNMSDLSARHDRSYNHDHDNTQSV